MVRVAICHKVATLLCSVNIASDTFSLVAPSQLESNTTTTTSISRCSVPFVLPAFVLESIERRSHQDATYTMTILSSNHMALDDGMPEEVTAINTDINITEEDADLCLDLPSWVEDQRDDWGIPMNVAEWDDVDSYRAKHGWKGRDLIHDRHAPVRVLEYFVQFGNGIEGTPLSSGGVDTTLTGIAHFTHRAESHKGFCHGGSMTSLLDDVIGWVAFVTTGRVVPWSGFTVQVNTSLKKPVPVGSFLLIKATITQVERRKVSVRAELIDPSCDENNIHAVGEGLVVLNRGVLPEEPQTS